MISRLFLGGVFLVGAVAANAALVSNTCVGTCGTDTGNGSVPNAPSGNPYAFVSTNLGVDAGGIIPTGAVGGETDGSTLTSSVFSAVVGSALTFNFNYITSDGTSTFPDYAWAALINAGTGNVAALLFTARTVPSPGNIVPGFGLPPNNSILTPAVVPIQAGTTWAELGDSSGACFGDVGNGCGNSGWVAATYSVTTAGTYFLAFGATNIADSALDSGLAIDNVLIGGTPVPVTTGTPEPATMTMLLFGLGATVVGARRAQRRKL